MTEPTVDLSDPLAFQFLCVGKSFPFFGTQYKMKRLNQMVNGAPDLHQCPLTFSFSTPFYFFPGLQPLSVEVFITLQGVITLQR